MDSSFRYLLNELNINHQLIIPHTHKHNRKVEKVTKMTKTNFIISYHSILMII